MSQPKVFDKYNPYVNMTQFEYDESLKKQLDEMQARILEQVFGDKERENNQITISLEKVLSEYVPLKTMIKELLEE